MRAGYKQTEVGVIPEDWDVFPLQSVAKITSGKRLPMGYFVGNSVTPYPYIRVIDMRPGYVDTSDVKYVPTSAFPPIRNYRIFKEDLFISVAGTLGLVGRIPKELDGANLTENANRISSISCNRDYLLHVMLSPIVQGVIESEQTKGAQPKLALLRIRNFAIPLPSNAAEQTAIATALGDMDALLAAQDVLIAKKRAIKQGTMQELLTGKRRLPGFSGEWDQKPLGDALTIRHGRDQKAVVSPNGEIPILATGGLIGWANQWLYDKPSVLIGRKGTIDRPQYMDTPFWTVDTLFYSEVKDGHVAKFLYYRFCMIDWHVYNEASGVPSLSARSVEQIEVAVPSLEEQTAIAEVLSDLDAELAALEARRAKTAQLKQGMMQELLTGRIRLVQG